MEASRSASAVQWSLLNQLFGCLNWLAPQEPQDTRAIGIAPAGETAERRRLEALIRNYSSDLPLEDQAILLAIADLESGMNSAAKNPKSSAYGVFQIIDRTWRGLGFSTEQRNEPESQVRAGIKLYRENLRYLARRGLSGTSGDERLIEMYTLHHDGPGGVDQGGRAIAIKYAVPRFHRYMEMLNGYISS